MAAPGAGVPSDQTISELSSAVERMHHLLFLFSLWDEGFRQVAAGGGRGDALMRLGTTIDGELGQLDARAGVFGQICGDYPSWVNDGVRQALAQQVDPSDRDEAQRLLLAGAGDFATSGEARAQALVGRARSQREELRLATDGFKAAMRNIDWHGLSCDLGAVVAMGGGAICVISEGTATGACIAGAAGFLYVVVAC
jgi:hypothetical protein